MSSTELVPQRRFWVRHEFAGALSAPDGSCVEGLHILVEYDQRGSGRIEGIVFGSEDTMRAILPIFHKANHKLTLRNTHQAESGMVLLATDVSMPRIEAREWPGTNIGQLISQKIARLDLRNLTVQAHVRSRPATKRAVTFFLAGPRELWFAEVMRTLSYTGAATVRHRQTRIVLPPNTPLTARAMPYFLNDTRVRRLQHTTSVMALEMKPRAEAEALSDEMFLRMAIGVADDLTLLVSFLSRGWVVWHGYQYARSDCIETHTRRFRKPGQGEPSPSDGPIEWGRTKRFLRGALPRLRKYREKQFDVTMAITHCVVASRDIYADEKFSNWFTALEHLKDLHQLTTNTQRIMSESEFKKVAQRIRQAIDEEVKSAMSRAGGRGERCVAAMKEKVPELNRPPIRATLDALFKKWNVQWADLYPAESKLTIVKTRNDLVHSSKTVETLLFVKEMYRVQAIAERLLLRILGWKDVRSCPREYTLEWLSAPPEVSAS